MYIILFTGLSHAVMICAARIEWIKNSKSLIANRTERLDTGTRKNKKRKDQEEEQMKSDKMDDIGQTAVSECGNVLKEKEIEEYDEVKEKKDEEKEIRISNEYDTYYDTFISAVKGSRLYN